MATIGDQEEGNLLVPTRMPKHLQTGLWPTEAALFRSNLVQYDDIRAMLAEDVPFMRDTVMIATVKYISKNDMRAVTCTSSSISNTLAVWDYVSKHDDVITGAIFKEPAKVVPARESKLSKEAIKDATKSNHFATIPAAGRADHPGATVPKAPQQIVVWAAALSDGTVTNWGTDFCVLLNAMSQAGARIPVLVITKGAYGRFVGDIVCSNWNGYSGMAMWGLLRSARQEIPNIPMILVDVPYGLPYAKLGQCLLPSDSEQLYYHDAKFMPQIAQIESLVKKAQNTPGGGAAKTGNKPMFARKMFNWGRPESKMDNVWFRQKFICVGPSQTADAYTHLAGAQAA